MLKSLLKIKLLILPLALSLLIIILAVNLTLYFKPLYYYDIHHLNIETAVKLDQFTIKHNYNIILNYLKITNKKELQFDALPISNEAKIHFKEVRQIFVRLDVLLILCMVISIYGIYKNIRRNSFLFLKHASIALFSIPLILLIPFMINFDKSFTAFHKIFFNNDYWEFDPQLDPVINMLPQEFFFHCALFMLSVMVISSLIMMVIYRRKSRIN